MRQALRRLTRDECEAFLFRLVQGEAGLNLALNHRLKTEMKTGRAPASVARRTADEVFQAAERLSAEETMRTHAQVEERRVAALLQFAKREPQAWKEVEGLLQGYQQYDQAVALLRQLRELAEFQKTRADFNQKLKQIRERYKSRASFIQRLDRAGLA